MAGLDPISNVADAAAKIISLFKTDPTIKAQLEAQQSESQLQVQVQQIIADTSVVTAVNTTMQAETKSAWFSRDWRPLWGYLSAIAFFFQIAALCVAIIFKPSEGPSVAQLVTVLTPSWGVPLAVLGVTAWHQGQADVIKAKNGD